jgi:hypothetical protein
MLFPLLFRYRPFYGKLEAGLLNLADNVGPVDMWGDKHSDLTSKIIDRKPALSDVVPLPRRTARVFRRDHINGD